MSYELIVTEKPSQAKKIAEALADTSPSKHSDNTVPYYEVVHKGKKIFVVSAVGHVYSLAEKEKNYKYPSYDIEWVPAFQVNKGADYTKKYVTVIKKLAKHADEFTVACDFDVEGEVIGLNVIRYACKQKDANRMKFSTLTKPDLIKAYENKQDHLEWGQAKAGETRHFLDWMYGINISRALSIAIKKAGLYKLLSSGRVQGPALKIIVDKEKDIRKFIPTPYYEIEYTGDLQDVETSKKETILCQHKKGKITDKELATSIHKKISGKNGKIKAIDRTEKKTPPPYPFDLTTLQTESYRSLKIAPKDTLAIAQELYSNGYTSYPRTSSQQLPKELEPKKLIENMLRAKDYKELAQKLLDAKRITPRNGKKTDPAHPAIHPTGIIPDFSKLGSREIKVYDLIVRRFLATFADDAVRETNKLTIDVESEDFISKGTRTIYSGWHEFYGPHVKLEEQSVPKTKVGEIVTHKKSELHEKMTTPPKRYTPASLIKELEKRNLGTKATRASIIETLFDRDYVTPKSLEATEMGIKITDILETYIPDIVKEDLTRQFEEEMEQIREGKLTETKTLELAKTTLTKILEDFRTKEKDVGQKLRESYLESQEIENNLGECPICNEGSLMIRYSPKTKQKFIGCSNYPDCKTLFNLPGDGKSAKSTTKTCESCKYPMIQIGTGRSQRIACFNPKCPVKIEQEKEQQGPELTKALESPCPNCGEKSLTLRKSMYGQFIGCGNYPKCKTIIQIPKDGGPIDMTPVPQKAKKKKSTKKSTKKANKKSAKKSTKKSAKKVAKKTAKKAASKK
jgi:DNA topoisomerase-1